MLYVCYMFSKHITCFKASVYRGLRPVMLYGYMFLRSPGLQGSKVRASWPLGIISKPLGDSSFTPKGMLCVTHGRHRSTPITDIGTRDKLYLYQMEALIDPIMGFSR